MDLLFVHGPHFCFDSQPRETHRIPYRFQGFPKFHISSLQSSPEILQRFCNETAEIRALGASGEPPGAFGEGPGPSREAPGDPKRFPGFLRISIDSLGFPTDVYGFARISYRFPIDNL